MQPLFTVHGGEYLVASHIEKRFKHLNLWLPSKDTGVDLLVTDNANRRTLALQVKFSKDYLFTHTPGEFRAGLRGCGWYRISRKKLDDSKAQYWVFVQWVFKDQSQDYIIVPTEELRQRLNDIHSSPDGKEIQSYLWTTVDGRCWESRGLTRDDQRKIARGEYDAKPAREFTQWLNEKGWKPLEELNNRWPK